MSSPAPADRVATLREEVLALHFLRIQRRLDAGQRVSEEDEREAREYARGIWKGKDGGRGAAGRKRDAGDEEDGDARRAVRELRRAAKREEPVLELPAVPAARGRAPPTPAKTPVGSGAPHVRVRRALPSPPPATARLGRPCAFCTSKNATRRRWDGLKCCDRCYAKRSAERRKARLAAKSVDEGSDGEGDRREGRSRHSVRLRIKVEERSASAATPKPLLGFLPTPDITPPAPRDFADAMRGFDPAAFGRLFPVAGPHVRRNRPAGPDGGPKLAEHAEYPEAPIASGPRSDDGLEEEMEMEDAVEVVRGSAIGAGVENEAEGLEEEMESAAESQGGN
ncbi:hypothetical protein DFJ74DRAFT_688232 [Hyaloraphidium curvatum]|nr:hypothetical protein DFJ74DRAFT_688232 [Hyaloraphidium curvatum]